MQVRVLESESDFAALAATWEDLQSRAVTSERDIVLVEEILERAIGEPGFDFQPLLEKARRQTAQKAEQRFELPTKVITDNKSHRTYTLVEIATPDRVGLLYDLLSALEQERVSIALSRISTEKGAAIDTFYVADRNSRGKITDSARIAELLMDLARDIAVALAIASPWIVVPAVTMWRIRRSRDLAELPADPPPDAPLVSVVIPARDERRNIEACLRSVLAATYPALEVVVVDDRSRCGFRPQLMRREHDRSLQVGVAQHGIAGGVQ